MQANRILGIVHFQFPIVAYDTIIDFANCYGCGHLNQDGLQIKSYWEGEESVCHFTPRPYHTGGIPKYLCSGLIAFLIDSHGADTTAAKARFEDQTSDDMKENLNAGIRYWGKKCNQPEQDLKGSHFVSCIIEPPLSRG